MRSHTQPTVDLWSYMNSQFVTIYHEVSPQEYPDISSSRQIVMGLVDHQASMTHLDFSENAAPSLKGLCQDFSALKESLKLGAKETVQCIGCV